jgi:NADH-quinone oxidoreductase subunit A
MLVQNYLPALIYLGIATVIGMVLLALGFTLGRGSKDDAKRSPYECGFEPFADSRMKFDVRYYLVAILFIIFDLEIAFLFPWAISLDAIGLFGVTAMGIFLAVLVVGFIYEWKKGALEWD